jgi:hypothetical protein
MAGETDGILLLINMLMGVDVKPQRDDGRECCYLGPAGCILRIKPIFCLNYNCSGILQGMTREDLLLLEKAAANVLQKQVRLEAVITQKLFSL